MQNNGRVLKKLKIELLYNVAIPPLGIYLKETKIKSPGIIKLQGKNVTGNLKHTQKEVLWNDQMLWSLKSGTGIKTGE